MSDEALLHRLRAAVGPRFCLTEPDEVAPHLVETRGLYRGSTLMVVRPGTVEAVAETVRLCAAERMPVVPQGGNTGLVGGGVPEGRSIVLDTSRLARIRALDAANFAITVDAGCILADIQKAASEADRLFPLSLGAEGSCRIGGNISTNAGGIQVLRYGTMRDLVLGLEVVLPSGELWDGLRALRKDNTGYGLKHLFIGAEGTLGVVTGAVLKLFPKPVEYATAFLGLERIDAVMALFERARAATADQLTAFELIGRSGLDLTLRHVPGTSDPLAGRYPWYALIELSSPVAGNLGPLLEALLSQALESGLIGDGTIASTDRQRRDLWRLREGVVEAQPREGGSIKHDVSVPISEVARFVERATAAVEARLPGIRPVPFGHVGDGNIHFNLTQPLGMDKAAYLARWAEFNTLVHDIAVALGGSISAEHGIGRLKPAELARYRSPLELRLMAELKRALDPDNIMNPGKILPSSILEALA